jgi:hypothetical protein
MALNVNNFVLSLTVALAAAAGSSPSSLTLGTDLFATAADETVAAAAYAVFHAYGGPEPQEFNPVPEISVQCMVNSGSEPAAVALAQRLYETLYNDVFDEGDLGRPRFRWDFAAKAIIGGAVSSDPDAAHGWRVHLVKLRGVPAVIGKDPANKRTNVVFNFDVVFELLTA